MTYRILRYEKSKDSNNNDQVFISLEINDGTALYNRAEWLTQYETAQLLADESLLTTFADQIADRGRIAYYQAKAEQTQ
jgi:hypothetical protein